MISKVPGNWTALVELDGGAEDEDLEGDEFMSLMIQETTDMALPVANLVFITQSHKKVKAFTEPGAKIKLGIADGDDNVKDASFYRVFNKLYKSKELKYPRNSEY